MRRSRAVEQPTAEPIGPSHVADGWSETFRFGPGHRLRGSRCAHCGMLIGGSVVRTVTITDFRYGPCPCGAIPTATYLMCADHPVGDNDAIIQKLHVRWLDHHGRH